jgi:SAM-dependent methyltransferase
MLVNRIEQAMLVEFLRPLGPGASVLDVGCGTGHFSRALAERGFRVYGVDPEPAMLAIAQKRVPVVCADGLRLPFGDGAFDAAVLVAVLEFTSDPTALLIEARRVARERVVVLALASWSWLGLRRRISGWLGHAVFSRATFRSRARIVAAARAAGCEPQCMQTALFLPPSIAGRLPRVEGRLSRRALPFGGILGLALPGGATEPFAGQHPGTWLDPLHGVTPVSGSNESSPLA